MILLPIGWERSEYWFGVVLHWPDNGFVTISEKKRGFALGHGSICKAMNYEGRGWRDRLYADAIKALQDAAEGK